MRRKNSLGVAAVTIVAICFAFESKAEPSREEVEKAWIGTWVGNWRTMSGDAEGKIRLVVHDNKAGMCNAVITFLSGSPTFGPDPFIPRVTDAPSADSLTFSGERNGASFTLALQLMANGIELRTNNKFMDSFPDNLKGQLVKQ